MGGAEYAVFRPDPSSLAEHGTALASTRTRPFEAVALSDYVAARMWSLFIHCAIAG